MLTRRQALAASVVPFCLPCSHTLADDPTQVFTGTDKPTDARLGAPKTLNDYYPFKAPKTLDEWEARKKLLREQLLVANGLWPLPEKTPLNAVVHGKVERDGYTIEKVYFASRPGHFVSGNLYRPATGGDAKRPAVLFAHGHWAGGRFEVATDKAAQDGVKSKAEATFERAKYFMQAIPITLARLGFVVFQYDMVGYADSTKLDHRNGFSDAEAELRGQHIMGLQTWNSLRALDFVESLPDVDPKRIGMTGASGGGTQTFITCAIDDRPAAAFPAVMVSTEMQGGCVCENCSLLRVRTTNVEVAAMFAPKPQAMSCANDWTSKFLKDGYGLPELKTLYGLYGKSDNVAAKAWLEYGHNYNQPAREFMYSWFLKHLMGKDEAVTEPNFTPTPIKELSVYDAKHPRPGDEKDAVALRKQMTEADAAWLKAATPDKFRAVVGPALRAMVNSQLPKEVVVRKGPLESKHDGVAIHRAVLGRKDENDAVPSVGAFGPKFADRKVVVWVHPLGKASLIDGDTFVPAAKALLDAGYAILAGDVLGAGEQAMKPWKVEGYAGLTYGYNRSRLANRVHDILTLIGFSQSILKAKTIHLVGWAEAGPWAALAKALAGDAVAKTAVDLNRFAFENVTATDDPMMLPRALKYGGLPSFLALCTSGDLLTHNDAKPSEFVKSMIPAGHLTQSADKWPEAKVAEWLTK